MELHSRHARPLIEEAFADTPVVMVQGARQSGKSTLVTGLAEAMGVPVLTMDDSQNRQAATLDPAAFIDSLGPGPAVIDEVQRVPSLILPIKASVDRDRRPGRFLLTGSADLLRVPGAEDSLAGRAETVRLHPLSQGELSDRSDDFVTAWLRDGFAGWETTTERRDVIAAICAGGFPEAKRRAGRRRSAWLRDYVDRLLRRDASEITRVAPQLLAQTLELLAAQQASEFVAASMARHIGGAETSVAGYLDKLRSLYLAEIVPAWSRSLTRRKVKRPKVVVTDSALCVELSGLDEEQLLSPTGAVHLGGLMEGFVANELIRQQTWSATTYKLSHYRESGGAEIDLIIDLSGGRVLAIEVKATSSVGRQHISGLVKLRDRLGADFVGGIVLYSGTRAFSMGERISAIPVPALWEL